MKTIHQPKFLNTLSVIMVAFLLLFTAVKNIPRLILVIAFALPIIWMTKSFSGASLFRILSVEISLLPAIQYPIDIRKIRFTIPDYRDFLQAVITFSELIRILIPVFLILMICVGKKYEKPVWPVIKKYIPYAVAMAILSLIGTFVPEIRELCKMLFTYPAIIVLCDLTETYFYKECYRLFFHLPFFFLYMTSLFHTLTLPNSSFSLRYFLQ